ncbi:MAG TPA: hypothetical protein VHL34_01035 [Rhizomicrobium sp.]|jgi:hypothetical protein|nr:hypothetical protein [Rhizomicrobium sp.]
MKWSAVAGALLLLTSLTATAAEIPPWCRYTVLDVPKGAPRFEDHMVAKVRIAHPAEVDVRPKDARLFRTQLREAVKGGTNFAGHYTIASWGCGTGCLSWAVIDQTTGKVTFPAGMGSFSNYRVDFDRDDAVERFAKARHATYVFGVLMFRAESDLLITMGAPDEGDSRDGVAYYRWTGTRFDRIAFYPAAKICPKPKD